METNQTGQTSAHLTFEEKAVAVLQPPRPNRMDLRFLLNGSLPLNIGFTQKIHLPNMHISNVEATALFDAQHSAVGKTNRRADNELGSSFHDTVYPSLTPDLPKCSKASLFLSPTTSPENKSPTTTTPTTVVETLSRDDKRNNSKGSYGNRERMQRSIKQLHAISNGSATRGSFSKRKMFPCDQCGFLFGMRSNLKRHILTVHEDRRMFACPICQSAFGLKQNLATHIRVKHEKQRPFECDICKQSFGYKQVLQNHRRNIHHI